MAKLKLTITLTPETIKWVDEQVKRGRFADRSHAVCSHMNTCTSRRLGLTSSLSVKSAESQFLGSRIAVETNFRKNQTIEVNVALGVRFGIA